MKVHELIAILSKQNPETDVVVYDEEAYYVYDIEIENTTDFNNNKIILIK